MGSATSRNDAPRLSNYPGQRSSVPQMTRNPSWQNGRTRTATAASTSASSGTAAPTTRPPSSSASSTISHPGAYTISRNAQGSPQVFRVTIPSNVSPNQEFQVYGESCLLYYIIVYCTVSVFDSPSFAVPEGMTAGCPQLVDDGCTFVVLIAWLVIFFYIISWHSNPTILY
jgi:hypothetical protein